MLFVEPLSLLSNISDVVVQCSEFGKSCFLGLGVSGRFSWWLLVLGVVSKPTFCLKDSPLLGFCWSFRNTSCALNLGIGKPFAQFLTTGSVLTGCSTFTTLLVLPRFGFDSTGEKSLISHNFLFLSVDGTWWFSESAEIMMLLNGL